MLVKESDHVNGYALKRFINHSNSLRKSDRVFSNYYKSFESQFESLSQRFCESKENHRYKYKTITTLL